jgi:steroid delta-isomerase-like uncharacterized protein
MRRLVVALSLLALVAALFMRAGVMAQEASPEASPMAAADIPEPLAAWVAAWAAGDIEGIVAAYTDDAVYEEVPFGIVAHGKDEVRAHIEELFAPTPDLSLVVTNAFVAGDRAAVEWTVTATYTGQMAGLPAGTGQTITVRGTSILELEGDKIRADREYWDALSFLQQVGALPAPEAAGTPTA